MPTLQDIFDLPDQVHQGDFVLKLSAGVQAPDETVRDYVVTPELARCFDDALGIVKSAVEGNQSKGAYLHGSFGAGKSHFMAMLSLLLAGNPLARAKPELASVVSRHNAWTQGRKFLVVPYHMINAESLEAALFAGYVEQVKRLHPDAALPGVYQSEGLFADARRMRERMGDEAFFAALNERSESTSTTPAGAGSGWGRLPQGWTVPRFEAALAAEPGSGERRALVGRLAATFYASQSVLSAGEAERYTTLDDGLAAISQHAQSLGYHAVVLFLDEFILWLATRASDAPWIAREGQKVAKLVEAGAAQRPIPLVSFMARQRDLRELVGEHMPGLQQLGFADVLLHWEARFDKVLLEDRNLPEIAKKRLLRPRNAVAAQTLRQAVDQLLRARPEVMQTLLTRDGDAQMLRDLYPFTPALVQTLIAVSSLLQRERTALKLMLQILVDQRARLEIGDVVPVGDLFDVIAEGDEPFTHGVKLFFEQAKQLWRRKLLPLLEGVHGVGWSDVLSGHADPTKARALRNDARLLKTLMMASLVPGLEVFRDLTVQRLVALNHGTIRTPVPGSEVSAALNKVRAWAGQIGEIKVVDDSANPVVRLEVTSVNTDVIIANATGVDNDASRRRAVRELVTESMALQGEAGLVPQTLELVWRGSKRRIDLSFANVRELSSETLRGREGAWQLLIDFPFDERLPMPYGPRDDREVHGARERPHAGLAAELLQPADERQPRPLRGDRPPAARRQPAASCAAVLRDRPRTGTGAARQPA